MTSSDSPPDNIPDSPLAGPLVSRRGLMALGGLAAGGSAAAVLGSALLTPDARATVQPPAAGAAGGSGPAGLYFPPVRGEAWASISPARAGWDPVALQAALAYAQERASTGVVILHRGRRVAERYWDGAGPKDRRDIASAQKSIMTVLVGIAVRRHGLRLDAPVSRWLGEGWSAAPAAREARITVRHLLSMSSGLDDQLRYVAPAGTVWNYNNTAYQRLHPLVEKVTGSSLQRFSTRVLFAPIGATSALWVGRPLRGDVGLRMTPRDMARFGLLTLAGGRWAGGAPLVPPAHLRASLSTSQRMNPSYGYLWWLNGKPSHRLPGGGGAQPGPLFPNAPRDLVAALGAGDQKIYVVPSLDLVVVRQGTSAGRGGVPRNGFDDTWWKLLRRAVPRRA